MTTMTTQPTILATSGGFRPGRRTSMELDALITHAFELAGTTGRPRMCHVSTASGDDRAYRAQITEAAMVAGVDINHLTLFGMPPTDDLDGFVADHDIVWVNGGSVANLLAVWRVHGLDQVLHRAWLRGMVLGGVSAGSLCWHVGGPTDSFGPELRTITDGLGWLPYGNGVHYDSEPRRRILVQAGVADQTLPTTYCTDDGVGLVYRGTELTEVVGERDTGGAYVVRRVDGVAVEDALTVRRLGR